MGYFSNTPAIVALYTASRGIKGGGGGEPDKESDNMMIACLIMLFAVLGIPILILSWVILTSFIGNPVHTRTDAGTIVSIESRRHKSTFYHKTVTTKGYEMEFYRDMPVYGETLYKDITLRPFQRDVMFSTESGCHSGYRQIWPFMEK